MLGILEIPIIKLLQDKVLSLCSIRKFCLPLQPKDIEYKKRLKYVQKFNIYSLILDLPCIIS